jgi:hypothetical protein
MANRSGKIADSKNTVKSNIVNGAFPRGNSNPRREVMNAPDIEMASNIRGGIPR